MAAACFAGSRPKGSLDYTYAPHGWLVSQKQVVGGSTEWDQTFTYDGSGRVTNVAYPNSVSVGYSYAYGRLDKVAATSAIPRRQSLAGWPTARSVR